MNTRQINILRDLLSSNDYITGKELSEKYGVSTKTAYTDLSDINEELKAFHVEIERKPRLGIRLDINRDKKSKVLQFIEQSHNEQFDEASIFRRDCEILQKLILGSGKIDVIDWPIALHLLNSGAINIDKMITKKFPLEEWRAAFESVMGGKEFKVMIESHPNEF